MNVDEAQVLALDALRYVAEDADRLDRFMALSGCGSDDIRDRIGDAAFLGGVLDYLLAHEPDLLAFADWADIDPALAMRARHLLP